MDTLGCLSLTRHQPHGHESVHHTETSLQSRLFARHLLPKVKSLSGFVRLVLPIISLDDWDVSCHVFLFNIYCDQENQEKCQDLNKIQQLELSRNENDLAKLTTSTPPANKTISNPPEIALPLTIAF